MSIRRLALAISMSLCALVATALTCGSAQAAIGHPYLSQLTGTPAARFSNRVCGVTVDLASQDLYVADPRNNVIDVFESGGAYQSQTSGVGTPRGQFNEFAACSVAVNDSSGDVYVADSSFGDVYVFNALGFYLATMTGQDTPDGSFGSSFERVNVAIDQANGDLYVADAQHGVVDRFNAAGEYQSQLTGLESPSALTIDSSGHILVATVSGIHELSAAGTQLLQISSTPEGPLGHISSIAVDGAGDIYAVDTSQEQVDEFSAVGDLIGVVEATPSGALNEPLGVAVNSAEDLYVVDRGTETVDIFGPGVVVPSVTVTPPTGMDPTAATLNGSVDPAGLQVTSCQFEYGLDKAYGQSAPCAPQPGSGSGAVGVSASLAGLRPHTTYHFRLSAGNADGLETSRDQVFTTPAPPSIEAESTEVDSSTKAGQTTATLHGQIAPNGSETTYHFEYGETSSYGTSVPVAPASLGAGEESVSVPAAELSGLKLATTYHYRLVASNAFGSVDGADQTFTTLGALLIDGESVGDVTSTSVTLQAQLNPLGLTTTYRFEYGPSSSYGTSVPIPAGDAGAGEGEASAEVTVQGLQAESTYHYRVVATNQLGTIAGADHTFTTQRGGSSFALSDDRQWQMVSPPEKHGAELEPISEQAGLIESSASGEAFTYVAETPDEAEPQGFAGKLQELAKRGPSGWSPITIALPHAGVTSQSVGEGQEYRFFSSDLSIAAIQPQGVLDPALSPEASESTAFLHTVFLSGDVAGPCTMSCYRPLVTGAAGYANVPAGVAFGGHGGQVPGQEQCYVDCGPLFVAATPDFSHVVISSVFAKLTEDSEGQAERLYEWANGRLTFIGIGHLGGVRFSGVNHALSANGERAVIDGEAGGLKGLLLRDIPSGRTVELDAVQGGSGEGPAGSFFQGASSDDSRVFFTDEQRLTADASPHGYDLYECEIVEVAGTLECKLTDLTPNHNGEASHVVGEVLGISEDGSWVYFAANGTLGTSAAPGECEAFAGPPSATCPLFALHRGSAGTWEAPRAIARLSQGDQHDWFIPSNRPVRISPDGEWLAFMSQASPTGYDNRDAVTSRPVAEVYLYDAASGLLSCASCDPTGARPVGVPYHDIEAGEGGVAGGTAAWSPESLVAANVPPWQQTDVSDRAEQYQSRYLFDSGRMFFNSEDALVSQDVNGTEDVYEYEPPSVGTCTRSSNTYSERGSGCVGLISSGISPEQSGFLDASEGGGDVFFLTTGRLLSQDFDTSFDIYDAHVCTSAQPCATVVTQPPPCTTADSCKPPPSPQPAQFGAPASATFTGAGNVTPSAPPAVKPRKLTRSQKLKRALGVCHAKHGAKRSACERKAKRRYDATSARGVKPTTKKRG